MDNLEDILSGNEDAPPEAVEAPEAVVEAPAEEAKPETVERPRGPDGKFIPKGETVPEAPAAASPAAEEPQLDHAALIGERRRRQEAEQERETLRQQLAALQQPAPQPAPDQWEDPEGYAKYQAEQLTSEAVSKAVEAARQEAYQTFQTQRIAISADEAKAKFPDYAEKMQTFEQMMQGNPQLLQELYRAPNPAEYAYTTAKTQMEITQYGSLDALIAARVQEALQAQAPAAPAQPPIPDSLASEQSARGSAVAYQPPSLEDILKR